GRLADAGVETAVVNVHYFADTIEKHVKPRTRPKIVISDERSELLDTGGGVVKALPLLGAEPFFHVNSDTIWIEGVTPNLKRLGTMFDPAKMDGLLLLAATATSIGYDGRGALAGLVQGCAERAVLAQSPVRSRDRGRPAVRHTARRHLDACRHARRR